MVGVKKHRGVKNIEALFKFKTIRYGFKVLGEAGPR